MWFLFSGFVKSSHLFVCTNNNVCLLSVVTFRFKPPVWPQKPFQTIVVMKSLEEKTHKSHIQIQQNWFMQKKKEKRNGLWIWFLFFNSIYFDVWLAIVTLQICYKTMYYSIMCCITMLFCCFETGFFLVLGSVYLSSSSYFKLKLCYN